MQTEEIKTIKSIKKGNLDDFTLIYEKYVKKIYDFVYYKTHHKETAEDIVSSVFMKALNNISGFDCGKGTIQAWLYKIARNSVIDHYRGRKNDKNIEDIWDLAGDDSLEEDFDVKNKLTEVKEYLKKIKSSQRDIIIMRLWQGLSYREISEILGKSEASCKMSYSRSIRKLRQEMSLGIFLCFVFFGL